MNDISLSSRQSVPVQTGQHHRFMAVAVEVSGENMLKATLSSETPVRRDNGLDEILVHTPEAVNLTRAAMGLPLLIDHGTSRQLGRVENIRLEGRKLVGDIRLSEQPDLAGVVADIHAGIRPDLSIGYLIDALEDVPGGTAYRVTRWTLYEVSSVALPADHTVGIGRSFTSSNRKVLTVTQANTNQAPNADEIARKERERINNIQAMGQRLNISPGIVTRGIQEGWTSERFANEYLNNAPSARAFSSAEGPVLDQNFAREARQFSLSAAIASFLDRGQVVGREAEISAELGKRMGTGAKGFFAPMSMFQERTQVVGTASAGGALVGTDYLPEQFISPLRKRAMVIAMGATVIPDLVGNVSLPRQDSATGGTWVSEDSAASESNNTFSTVGLSPRTVTANLSWSRQQALQGLPAMEQILRSDLEAQLGLALDRGALHGSGSGAEPRGLFNTAGIGSVAIGTNGGAPTWDHITQLEAALGNANADMGSLGYLTTPNARKKLKTTQRFTSTDTPIWEKGIDPQLPWMGQMNGYAAGATTQVKADFAKGIGTNLSGMAFGNWADLVIGLWAGLDILVDPYAFSDRGRVRITGFLSADIGVKHPESFAAITDIVTS